MAEDESLGEFGPCPCGWPEKDCAEGRDHVSECERYAATTGYDYEADIARGSNIRKPGERPWAASRRLRREAGLDG